MLFLTMRIRFTVKFSRYRALLSKIKNKTKKLNQTMKLKDLLSWMKSMSKKIIKRLQTKIIMRKARMKNH